MSSSHLGTTTRSNFQGNIGHRFEEQTLIYSDNFQNQISNAGLFDSTAPHIIAKGKGVGTFPTKHARTQDAPAPLPASLPGQSQSNEDPDNLFTCKLFPHMEALRKALTDFDYDHMHLYQDLDHLQLLQALQNMKHTYALKRDLYELCLEQM